MFLFLALLPGCKSNNTVKSGKTINIGSHEIHYLSKGIGYPVIILDVGFAESYQDWLPLINQLSLKTKVVAFDRAGYGNSETGPFPRNCFQVAVELEKLLQVAEINGPYILLGHSLGALNLEVFADRNKPVIAGLVLLDPPPLSWLLGKGFPDLRQMAAKQIDSLKLAAASLKRSADPAERSKASYYETLVSEHQEMFFSSARQVAEISSFSDIPLFVIGSDFANPAFGKNAVQFQKFWNDQCRELSTKSSKGIFIQAKKSTHHIHRDNPELVLNTVFRLLKQARNSN